VDQDRIRIILVTWIRIRIRIKVVSWIRNRIRIRINLQMKAKKYMKYEPILALFQGLSLYLQARIRIRIRFRIRIK
jgi:hypothetical protein